LAGQTSRRQQQTFRAEFVRRRLLESKTTEGSRTQLVSRRPFTETSAVPDLPKPLADLASFSGRVELCGEAAKTVGRKTRRARDSLFRHRENAAALSHFVELVHARNGSKPARFLPT